MATNYAKLYRGAKKGFVLNGVEVAGLERALRELGIKEARKVLLPAIKDALKPVAQEISATAPLAADESDQPTRKRGLHLRGAKFRVMKRSTKGRRREGYAIVTPTRKELGVSDKEKGWYPTAVEIGYLHYVKGLKGLFTAKKIPARPYMRPVFDRRKDQIAKQIATTLGDWMTKVWRRR